MPGTIQVTVLEFKGVSSSSSQSSAKSLKVSMGKRQYQTWDKGDFSFPITKIREDLVVALLDAGGNEIAHQDIRTMQIIEKGSWDEVFSINGGGHVHMKLQFILSEEDRNRIRVMRESVMKKKLETDPNMKLRLTEAISSTSDSVEISTKNEQKVSDSQKVSVEIDVVSRKVEASQAGSSLASATSSAVSLSSLQKQRGNILESAIPNATDGSQGAPSSPPKHEIGIETRPFAYIRLETEEGPSSNLSGSSISDKNNAVEFELQDDRPIQKSADQGPLEKTPSNVRKMISAFENSQFQEVKPPKKVASVPSQLNRFRNPADNSLSAHEDHILGNLHQTSTTVSGKAGDVSSDNEPSLVPKDLASTSRRQSTTEMVTSSGRMPEERSQATQSYELSSKSVNLNEYSVAEGSGRGRGTGLKSSTMIMASNPKPKTLEYYKEEYYSTQSSGMWIFPDNSRRLCITTAGKKVMKIIGHHHNEAKTLQVKKISSESNVLEKNLTHETEDKMEKKQKKFADQPASSSGSSPDDSSNGLVGQVIKIGVIIGFGVLVLLTRQREPRKKHKEEDDNLFRIPDSLIER